MGMRGLGCEVAKNLILAGPAAVDIYDPTPCEERDQGANFFIDMADVQANKSRAQASVPRLAQLNGYCRVRALD